MINEGMDKPVLIIGYSGHAYVIIDILKLNGRNVTGYCDHELKMFNPFKLNYLGKEAEVAAELAGYDYFPAVGQNGLREKIIGLMKPFLGDPINAIHPAAVVASAVSIGNGTMIAANVSINSLADIGNAVICNTGSIIEHECVVGDFTHIAPGAVLCGNVKIGERSFIGANSVIKQGVIIGNNVVVGAGSVVLKNLPDNVVVHGNPAA